MISTKVERDAYARELLNSPNKIPRIPMELVVILEYLADPINDDWGLPPELKELSKNSYGGYVLGCQIMLRHLHRLYALQNNKYNFDEED
ncbi:hypothetical protein [Pasteurella phage PHB01]|uniref:Uncharacterized protein n=2 Tax=Wuhanvirus TaxID=2731989 RepID=A0A218M4F4_9CAUD|nr:hypothetical protein HOR82_gp19 [Pasteurella phage vB_PmuP_PHB02]YP_009790812.1 hypothetical protein HOR83_gp26 [Pasteurella phage PHB01]UIS73839.1 hypothetical protein [Pasteurella phage vB_PmuP_PS07]UIS74043.1 hypothetical protein [Pasteurella phage vB_PmuP_PS30]ARV77583.1 hypothetical protein [Pasteurella phage vB_PmuP_PHB02]ASD51039.1 hypothetical protein [Pasteurella phage PHB01]